MGDMPTRTDPILGAQCKKCEYRADQPAQKGFRECWAELANPSPHLLDLYEVGRLKPQIIADLIIEGKTALVDVPPSPLNKRQAIQLRWTQANQEFIDPELPRILSRCKYPLHFLDFEATRVAVPYHAGMHPYGLVAFQLSSHTIPEPNADLQHNDWINVESDYPNFDFACRLKDVIQGDGTVFVWSSFERTVLKDIRDRLAWYGGDDATLSDWLNKIIDKKGFG